MKNRQGFTLIELLVVILIVGILAAIAVPMYQKSVENARVTEALIMVKNIADANKLFYLANGDYTWDLRELDVEIPGQDTTYGGMARKETEHFIYGARATSKTDATGTIAIANRLPADTYYSLRIFKDDSRVYCRAYSAEGDIICQEVTGATTKSGDYYIAQ